MKLTAEQRVQKAHVWLMSSPKYCLYSGIFMLGKTEVRDDVPTACTDGLNTYYGRKFIDPLTDQELRGLILHENLHKAFRHITIWRNLYDKNPSLANKACDFVINIMIYDSDPKGTDVTLPEGGCFDLKYRGLDAGTVFRLLEEEEEQGGGSGDGEGGESFDEHDWESGQSLTPEQQQDIENRIDQALRQGAMLAGKMNGNVPREITDALQPKVDWREVLREFITSTCVARDDSTWARPSRRWVSQDVYLPSPISISAGRIVVAVDTSGSIRNEDIAQFLGEVKAICDAVTPDGIDLLYWDTEVCRHETYDKGQLDLLLTSTKPAGGGGTDPQCVVDYMKEKRINAECAVILTDGYVPNWGNGWTCPVLWGITTKNITATNGISVHID
jgi:predicted metal-dependent peptidase